MKHQNTWTALSSWRAIAYEKSVLDQGMGCQGAMLSSLTRIKINHNKRWLQILCFLCPPPTTRPLDPLLKLSRWGPVIKLRTNKADALSMPSEVKTDFTVSQYQYAFYTMNGKANIIFAKAAEKWIMDILFPQRNISLLNRITWFKQSTFLSRPVVHCDIPDIWNSEENLVQRG